MSQEPVLARTSIHYHGRTATLYAFGGLRNMAGNSAPYFSLTGEVRIPRKRDCEECGMIHERILKSFPHLKDLAALHLSDISGVPTHAEENGWYWLAGALPEFAQERFHGGNSTPEHNPTDCLRIFAEYVRIDLNEAYALRGNAAEIGASEGWKEARAFFTRWIDAQRPRWQKEAEACINAHSLKVYGDPYTPQPEPETPSIHCDQCSACMINGVFCHETGCPAYLSSVPTHSRQEADPPAGRQRRGNAR